MSSRYSLICPQCQHSNPVTTTQAGQELECAGCQQPIQAPRLGQLKLLPAIDPAPSTATNSSSSGKLFVLGMIMLIFGGGGGAGLYYYASGKLFDYETKVEEKIVEIDNLIDNDASLIQLVQIYEEMPLEAGLPPWQEKAYVGSNKQGIILSYLSYGLLTIGGIGLICAIAGFFK